MHFTGEYILIFLRVLVKTYKIQRESSKRNSTAIYPHMISDVTINSIQYLITKA